MESGFPRSCFQDFHISFRSVYPNPLSVFHQRGRIFYAHDRGKTVLPGDNSAMGHLYCWGLRTAVSWYVVWLGVAPADRLVRLCPIPS